MPDQPLSRREALRAERATARTRTDPIAQTDAVGRIAVSPVDSSHPAEVGDEPSAQRTADQGSAHGTAEERSAQDTADGPEPETARLSDAALPFLLDGRLPDDLLPLAPASEPQAEPARPRRGRRGRGVRPQAGASARPPQRAGREADAPAPGHRLRKAAMTWLGVPALFACVALPAYALNAQGEPRGSVVGQGDPDAQSLEIANGTAATEQPAVRDDYLALSESERLAIDSGRISAEGIMSYLRGSDEGWFRPVAAPMTSPYGPRRIICNEAGCSNPIHEGIDFGAACGTPVKAVAAGTVRFVGLDGGYGNRVIVDHGDGVASVYGHLGTGTATVAEGDVIEAGVFVGDVGRTGVGTGCHLDLKIEQDGAFTDPQAFLTARGVVV